MTLLATSNAVEMLDATVREVESQQIDLDVRVKARLSHVQGILADDLVYIEDALAAAASGGEEPATRAAEHLVLAGGKRIRPITVLLSASCFGRPTAAARELAVVAELIHSATLLHDDVIDDGAERRGRVAARRVWGNAVSVLAGDLLLTHALDRTFAALPAAMPDLLLTLRKLVDGEVIQLRGRTAFDTAVASYFRILEDKTASLFGWAARAGAIAAGASEGHRKALGRFGEGLGVAFQLVDDLLDYVGDAAATGKSLYADLSEGKLTLPLLLALEKDPSLAPLLRSAGSGDEAALSRLSAAARNEAVCDEVRRRASSETARAVGALAELPHSPAREMLAAVATELTSRVR